jgi:hypothetical protein
VLDLGEIEARMADFDARQIELQHLLHSRRMLLLDQVIYVDMLQMVCVDLHRVAEVHLQILLTPEQTASD